MKYIVRKLCKSAILLSRPRNRMALLRYAVAGAIEHDVVLRSRPWDVVIDAGANRGQFSLAVRHFLPCARIVAFEPLASAARVYRKIFAHDPRVQLHETAIARQKGTATMQRSGSEDSSSMLPIGDLMLELFPGTQAVGTEKVAVAPLTDFLTSDELHGNSLLKIDVQGYELEVLASAEPLLPYLDAIYVETSFVTFYEGQALADEVIGYLQAHGFRLTGIMNPSFHPVSGVAVQADMLFVNAKRLGGH